MSDQREYPPGPEHPAGHPHGGGAGRAPRGPSGSARSGGRGTAALARAGGPAVGSASPARRCGPAAHPRGGGGRLAVVGVPRRAGRTPRTHRRRRPTGRRAAARRGTALRRVRRPLGAVPRPATAPAGPSGSGGGGRRWPRRLVWSLVALLGLGLLAPVVAFLVGWVMFDVPSANQTDVTQVATFKYADGAALATIRPDNVNRTIVPLEPGARARPAGRAVGRGPVVLLQPRLRPDRHRPGAVEPGRPAASAAARPSPSSTSRSPPGRTPASLWRKYKEIVLAVKISQEQTKDQILENYLNVIYFGRGAYGIQAASQAYFGKDVKDLSVAEGAMLAGTIQSPSRWDPAKNPEKSNERWNFVLDGMVAQGWLPAADRAQQKFPAFLPEAPQGGGIPGDAGGHRLQAGDGRARGPRDHRPGDQHRGPDDRSDDRLEAAGAGRRRRSTKVLKGQPANLRGALVSVDPKTGAILAYYGGVQRRGRRLRAGPAPARVVVQAVRAVARRCRTPARRSGSGAPTTGRRRRTSSACRSATPRASAATRATCSTAMTKSVNTVFYKMGIDTGPQRVVDAAHQAGIPSDELPDPDGGHRAGRQGGPPDRHGVGVRDVRGRRNPPRRLRGVEGDRGRRPGDLRPRHGDRAAGRAAAGRPQRHRGDDRRRGLRRDRPRRRAGRRQDRHRAAPDAERAEQGRLDGRLHPVGVDRRLGRHRPERSDQELAPGGPCSGGCCPARSGRRS